MLSSDVHPGEELFVSCEPATAVVVRITSDYVFIRWPWREHDQESRAKWDGTVALPREESSPEWTNTPWRVQPESHKLEVGGRCVVGIPRTRVLVRRIQEYDPPRSLGWLPRPTAGVGVVEAGIGQDDEEAGYVLYLDGAEPIVFERIEAQ